MYFTTLPNTALHCTALHSMLKTGEPTEEKGVAKKAPAERGFVNVWRPRSYRLVNKHASLQMHTLSTHTIHPYPSLSIVKIHVTLFVSLLLLSIKHACIPYKYLCICLPTSLHSHFLVCWHMYLWSPSLNLMEYVQKLLRPMAEQNTSAASTRSCTIAGE